MKLLSVPAAICLFALFVQAAPPAAVPNREPILPNTLDPLPLTSVKPTGWLLEQLRIQANGLSGHIDEFWPSLTPDSGWLGGAGESWERGPYYFDGLVPLAFLTGDARLIAKAKKWIDWTLANQSPDGWIGPRKNTDWWPNYVMLKALTQYQEATGDPRVIPVMQKYFAYQARHLDERPLKEWAIYRWADEVLSIVWLYNRTSDRSLLDLARRLRDQGHDWRAQFDPFRFPDKVPAAAATLATHGVNNAMALKTAALWGQVSGKFDDRNRPDQMLQALDRYHGQVYGLFSSDEHYAGLDPTQGTELCAIVEAMFSLELDMAMLGDPTLADRLERLAYNALPATLAPDLWSHQYDQQANQVLCSVSKRRWETNGPESNLFGLEPNFGCCAANMHQGWPKFVASLWMTYRGGLAAIVYAPSEVSTTLEDGVAVTISEQTDYPFRDTVTFTFKLSRPATFPLMLRVPPWAVGATLSIQGDSKASGALHAGMFSELKREWRTGDRVVLRLPMSVRVSHWLNNSIAVERGPLVFSLQIGEHWRKLREHGPAADWEVFPTSPWNYGLVTTLDDLASTFTVAEKPLARQPFDSTAAPVEIRAPARRLSQWQMVDDSAGPLPASPVKSERAPETVTLVPYGAAKLRVTAFPYTLPDQKAK